MNIPNLDFEISLIKGFWNAPSKIDWYHSIPQEGTISIIVSVVLLVFILVRYAGYEFKQMKLWQSIALVFSIPIFFPSSDKVLVGHKFPNEDCDQYFLTEAVDLASYP